MNNSTQQSSPIQSLEDIRLRREALLTEIRNNSQQMNALWKSMLGDNQQRSKSGIFSTSSVIKTGVGIFDGFMFAWKLYRKFKR